MSQSLTIVVTFGNDGKPTITFQTGGGIESYRLGRLMGAVTKCSVELAKITREQIAAAGADTTAFDIGILESLKTEVAGHVVRREPEGR